MNTRGFTWLDDSIEHSDSDYARAQALANKWSELHNADEQRLFRLIADAAEGRDYGPDYSDCECEYCLKANHECVQDAEDGTCSTCAMVVSATECESEVADKKAQLSKEAEQELEIELVEDKLTAIGARMMRPYEHHNEDERYIEYMERDRD